VRRSLWRENWSTVYNCYWSSPVQSFLGPSPVFYCLRFETPQTCMARSPYLYPVGTGGPVIKPCLAYNLSALTTQKTQFFHFCGWAVVLLRTCCLATGTCLQSRCPETALVYPPIPRSLHSSDSTCYNTTGTRIATVESLLRAQGIWAARLPIQDMTYHQRCSGETVTRTHTSTCSS
jgi:hypothetical protein